MAVTEDKVQRISVIKWATKDSSPEPEKSLKVSKNTNPLSKKWTSESDSDDDIVILEEFPPPTRTTAVALPPFSQVAPRGKLYPFNQYFHPIRSPYFQYNNNPFVNGGTTVIPMGRSNPNFRWDLACPLRVETPESDWVKANVYHLNPCDGVLRYKCQTCNGLIEQKSIRRQRQFFEASLPFQCTVCEKKYFTEKQLQLHQFRHSEKKLECPYCSKRFLTRSELYNHVNTHTGEKPYECPACAATFSQSSRYYAHIRNYHKKYNCHECFIRTYKHPTSPSPSIISSSDSPSPESEF